MTNTTNTETRIRQLQHLACIIDVGIKTMQRLAGKREIADMQEFKDIRNLLIEHQSKAINSTGTGEFFRFLTCKRVEESNDRQWIEIIEE